MGTRKKVVEEAPAVEAAKALRATKAAPAKKPAKKPASKTTSKKPGAPKRPAKPKSKTPLRKNTPRNGRNQTKPLATTVSAPPTLAEELGLTVQEALFVDIYLTHYNGRRAYQEAGYESTSDNGCSVAASKLIRRPNVAEYLRRRGKAMIERAEEEQDKLLTVLTYTAYGDANELVEHRIDCCRFCYGLGNLYHFTPQEFERHKAQHANDVAEAKIAGQPQPKFDPLGGVGFNPNLEPNSECPECFGRGREAVIVKDTRFLSPAAQALYAGIKVTKEGIEVKTNSQDKSREMLAKIHRLYDDNTKVELTFDPDVLNARFGEVMAKAHERAMETLEERRLARAERGSD